MSYIAYSGTIDTTTPGAGQGDQQAANCSIRNDDGSLATAPTPFVSNHPETYKVPGGGTTGQQLTKKSDDDGDFEWATA